MKADAAERLGVATETPIPPGIKYFIAGQPGSR